MKTEIIIAVVIFVALLEFALLATWRKSFFRIGVPVFARSGNFSRHLKLNEKFLEKRFRSVWREDLLFKQLTQREVGFREAVFTLHPISYPPFMRGRLDSDPEKGKFRITGLVNIYPLAFVSMMTAVPDELESKLIIGLGTFGLFLASYAIQLYRFNAVYKTLLGDSAWLTECGVDGSEETEPDNVPS